VARLRVDSYHWNKLDLEPDLMHIYEFRGEDFDLVAGYHGK
jgi:hypothetical protein